jgi:2-oxoglutarate dehydrogenase complex dehydrogenase (E1) component-like enzyme
MNSAPHPPSFEEARNFRQKVRAAGLNPNYWYACEQIANLRPGEVKEIVWCQEEPGNQGAWHRVQHYLMRHMRPDQVLSYALRPSSSSPAISARAHRSLPPRSIMTRASCR